MKMIQALCSEWPLARSISTAQEAQGRSTETLSKAELVQQLSPAIYSWTTTRGKLHRFKAITTVQGLKPANPDWTHIMVQDQIKEPTWLNKQTKRPWCPMVRWITNSQWPKNRPIGRKWAGAIMNWRNCSINYQAGRNLLCKTQFKVRIIISKTNCQIM